jgi:predicted nucleic acid-binding protein
VIYLDTNILIYLFENHPIYGEQAARTITKLQEEHRFTCSTITITECLAQVTDITLGTFKSLPGLSLVSLDEAVASRAACLQRETTLRIGDAIHLATALEQKADKLLTNDKQFAKTAKKYLPIQTLENA